jgi:hypothetical protein
VENLDKAQNYKTQYLSQFGVTCPIPSLYVQQAVWYPTDPSYFVQICNYVVPKDQDYDVNTYHHYEKKGKEVKKFEELFKDKITGCSIRLIKTHEDLSTITQIDEYVFKDYKVREDGQKMPIKRIDKLSLSFSFDGKVFVLFSKENNFIKVFKLSAIEDVMKIIEND